jgi:hypothetical protein
MLALSRHSLAVIYSHMLLVAYNTRVETRQ